MIRTMYALFASGLVLSGCTLVLGLDQHQGGDGGPSTDAQVDARDATIDASADDGGAIDSGRRDGGAIDGGTNDGGVDDGGANDGGTDDGGTDDGGSDGGPPTVGVGGTVVGLPTGETLRLSNGSDTEDVAGASGPVSFSFRVPPGGSYEVEIDDAPATLLCRVHRGAGTADADITNVFVGCSTAVDLVSWFPFDGDLHAARGDDWTSMTGAGVYTTDRNGVPNAALDAVSGFELRLARPLDGRSTLPEGSTQFTVTAWVRVPPALTSASDDQSLLAHYAPTAMSVNARIGWRDGAPRFELYFYWDGEFDQAVTESTTDLSRDWHHVAVSASGPSADPGVSFVRSVYVDGVREGRTATCCGWGNSTVHWGILSAAIQRDDYRLYDRMLSDEEIAGIYAAENVP